MGLEDQEGLLCPERARHKNAMKSLVSYSEKQSHRWLSRELGGVG